MPKASLTNCCLITKLRHRDMSPLILVLASRQTRLPQPPKTKAADPASNHYILSFDANTMIILDGEYFVKCEVVGPLQGKEVKIA
ncbi:hypothetical protein YC2023_084037 [Brassica napus]